jgi:hypothetical protein
MKPGSNSVEDHPQLSHNRHPVDDALVGAGSLGPPLPMCKASTYFSSHLFSYLSIYGTCFFSQWVYQGETRH